jgi:hypothetical protein
MRKLIILTALLVFMVANGCQSISKTKEEECRDSLRFDLYSKKGKIVLSHILYRDGRVELECKAKPINKQDNGYILDAKQTTAAWQLAASVFTDTKVGQYFNMPHEECQVEIRIGNQVKSYDFTHDNSYTQAPEKLMELMLILYGLSKW